MNTNREICVYHKTGNNLINRQSIKISISILSTIFQAAPFDNNYFQVYQIKKKEYNLLTKYVPEITNYTVDEFDLFMESFSG